CLRAAEVVGRACLVAASDAEVRVLLPLPVRGSATRAGDAFADAVTTRVPAVVTAGTPALTFATADRTLREAMHLMATVPAGQTPPGVRRLADAHIRGLLALLADDDRLRAFTDRELSLLRDHDDAHGHAADQGLCHLTRTVIEHWGSKSAAAAALNLSRPVLYDRITQVERLLRVSLADAEVRTSLHVAFLAGAARTDGTRTRRSPPAR
ncbi:MAG: helix-turn-helix domain-containing protein, partial [Nocardioides sp.]|uniref:helix-turn-helix domain-containing protein n=1 Tax=Nocardioides sp. TaxID=35761 RepID=UPI0039E44A52